MFQVPSSQSLFQKVGLPSRVQGSTLVRAAGLDAGFPTSGVPEGSCVTLCVQVAGLSLCSI